MLFPAFALAFTLTFTLDLALHHHAVEQGKPIDPAIADAKISAEKVIAGAEKMYRQRLRELSLAGSLDGDPRFLARVQRIAQPLLRQAAQENAASVSWQWEIHATSDPDESSYSMAGGKLLISQTQVQSLELNDAELAMLISHEIQHALLEHNLKEYSEALRLFPAWRERSFEDLEDAVDNDEVVIQALAGLGRQQELEADSAGLRLASRSGFPVASLLNFFRKLWRHSAYPNFESKSHPSPASRWQNAREQKLSLEKF